MTILGKQTIKDIKPEHLSKLNEPNVWGMKLMCPDLSVWLADNAKI